MPKQWIQGPTDPFGLLRMGWMNPAPRDEVRQEQGPPPVGQPLNTERYQSRADMLRERGFTDQVQSTGDPAQDAAQVSEAQEEVYRAFPMFRNFGIQVKDFRRDDAMNQLLQKNNVYGGLEFQGQFETGPPWKQRSDADKRHAARSILPSKESIRTQRKGEYVPTIELYGALDNLDPETGKATSLAGALFGDMLHQLSSKDPDGNYIEERSGAPQFQALLEQFDKTVRTTPSKSNPEITQLEEERKLWERRKPEGGKGSFEDYWEHSGRDAWVRAYLSPDERDEWRRQDVYTDKQIGLLDQMLSLFRGEKG